MHYLYRITHQLSGKVYIGQTIDTNRRWHAHKAYTKQNVPVQYIHRAMKKYGVENFTYEVIVQCKTQEDTDLTEELLIQQYDSQNKNSGYNIARGGEHAWNAGLPKEQQPMYGKKQSDYQKQRMSEVHKGSVKPPHTDEWKINMSNMMLGRENTWYDKMVATRKLNGTYSVSEETKEKLRAARLGTFLSEETKEKISAANTGKTISEETRKKLSIAHTGKVMSVEARQNMSIARSGENHHNYGKHLAEEIKAKISISNTGKIHAPLTKETRLKISKSNKGHTVSLETRIKIGKSNSLKLTDKQKVEIKESQFTIEETAKIFGISKMAVWRIQNNKK